MKSTKIKLLYLIFIALFSSFLYAEQEKERKPILQKTILKPITKKILYSEKGKVDSLSLSQKKSKYLYFTEFEELYINKISIHVFSPFGVTDTLSKSYVTEKGKSIVNQLHINTKENIVRNIILFKEGDEVNPIVFAESERYLRQNSYIYDAAIFLEKISGDSVNVKVFVQDVWSLQINSDIGFFNDKGNLRIKDVNFGGYGGTLTWHIKKNPEWSSNYKHDFEYKYSKLFNKQGVGRVYLQSGTNHVQYGLGLNNTSVQENIKFLGGFNIDVYRTNDLLIEPDSIKLSLDYHEKDLWAAFNYSIDSKKHDYNRYKHFIFGSRIIQKINHKDPNIDNHYYQDNVFVLVGMSFLNRSFYQESYLFSIGQTEDIPVGNKFEMVFGKEFQTNSSRNYIGLSSTVANYLNHYSYLLTSTKFGFYLNDNKFDNGILDFDNFYFSPLHTLKALKYRNYASVRYSKAIKPYNIDQLLDLKNQVRGLKSDLLKGDKRILLSFGINLFMPISLLGFHSALVTFADLALISGVGESIIENSLKSSLGFGIRINNEKLIFPTIQFSFVYFPNSEYMGSDPYHFITGNTNFYQIENMSYQKPHIYTW